MLFDSFQVFLGAGRSYIRAFHGGINMLMRCFCKHRMHVSTGVGAGVDAKHQRELYILVKLKLAKSEITQVAIALPCPLSDWLV